MTQKIQTTVYLDSLLRQRLKRISRILDSTETGIMENALQYYLEQSSIRKQVQKKIFEDKVFLQLAGFKDNNVNAQGCQCLNHNEEAYNSNG